MNAERPTLREVVDLVFLQKGKFLLEQRLDKDNYFGKWTFPGGKVDEIDYKTGKDYLVEASIREVKEEIGLIPKVLKRFTSFEEVSRNNRKYLFHGIHVIKYTGNLVNKEIGRRNLSWVRVSEAKEYIGDTAVDKRVFEDFLSYCGRLNK